MTPLKDLKIDFTAIDGVAYSFIDTPGDAKYLKNVISAITLADIPVLVVPSDLDALSRGDCKHPVGQAREHAALSYIYGLKQLIVCVTKMDKCGYSQNNYMQCCETVSRMLRVVGYDLSQTVMIPVSSKGDFGENVIKPSTEMEWYKGPTLMEAL